MVLTVPDDEFPREPQNAGGSPSGERTRTNVAMRASRIRSRLVFTLIDAVLHLRRVRPGRGRLFPGQGAGSLLAAFCAFPRCRLGRHPRRQPRLRPLRPHVAPRRCRGGPPAGAVGRHRGRASSSWLYPLGRMAAGRACAGRRHRRRMHVRHRGDGGPALPLAAVRLAARLPPGGAPGGRRRQPRRRCRRHPGDAAQPGGRAWSRWPCSTTTPGPTACPCSGVPVVGSIDDIPDAASRYTLQQVLLAIPNPPPELVRAGAAGLRDGRADHEGPSRW